MIEYSGNCRFDSSGPASSYVISTRCNRKPFGRYEGTKQMISSFLKSSNVSSGVECTAETENTNAHRTNHEVIGFIRFGLITRPISTIQSSVNFLESPAVTNELIFSTDLRPMSGTSAFSAGCPTTRSTKGFSYDGRPRIRFKNPIGLGV